MLKRLFYIGIQHTIFTYPEHKTDKAKSIKIKLKGGLSLKIKKLHIHLYFIATYEIMPLWKI